MGKARREREMAKKKKAQRNKLIAAGIAAVAVIVLAVVVISNGARTSSKNLNIALSEDGSLHIARTELGNGLNYVDWGGDEELILYKNGDEVRAAFDTCEECYPQGSVHFTRNGDMTTCSICGTTSAISGLGAQSWGGCQPLAIPSAARMDTDDEIVVSSDAIDYAVYMLEQWDAGDMSVTFENFGE